MTAFRFHLIRVGIPTGLMVGFGVAFQGTQTLWLDLLLTVCAVALLLAGVLTVVTAPFVRSPTRTRVGAVGLVTLVVLATLISGVALMYGASRLPHGGWVRLPDPPHPAKSFAGPTCYKMNGRDNSVVFVTISGNRYLAYRPGNGPGAGWTEELAVPDSILQRADGCTSMTPGQATPFKFGNVVARYRVDDNGVDCGGRRHYLLMADQSIWTWSTGACALISVMGALLFIILLALLGLFGGLGVLSRWVSPAVSGGTAA